jgi:hypothetical protein
MLIMSLKFWKFDGICYLSREMKSEKKGFFDCKKERNND